MFMGISCLVVFVFALISLYFFSFWNDKKKYNELVWFGSYECGFLSSFVGLDMFGVYFFLLMVVFVIFDLEVSLLFSMPMQGIMYDNRVYFVLFLVLLIMGFCVEVWSGFVSWGA